MLFSPGVDLLPMSKHQQPWRQRIANVWHFYLLWKETWKDFLNSFLKNSRHRGCNEPSKTTNETVSQVTKLYRKPRRRQNWKLNALLTRDPLNNLASIRQGTSSQYQRSYLDLGFWYFSICPTQSIITTSETAMLSSQHVIECCVYVWRLRERGANLGRQDASRRRGGNSSPSRCWSSKGGRGTSIKLSYYLIISAHTNLLSIKSSKAVISSRPAPPLSQILYSAGNHLAASWKAAEQHS